jgi:uncharacterized protein with HEPN domain/predicted nucleotidyltransferase
MAKDATPIRDLIAAKREEILAIARRYGAQNVRVFGSVARGDETAQSDVDLLVDLTKTLGLFEFVRFKRELEGLLGRDVDLTTEKTLHPRIRQQMMREGGPGVKGDLLYLDNILECMDRILSYTHEGRDAFMKSEMMQDAVIRNFEIMGEAAKRVSDELREKHPDIPWKDMVDFRNVLIHGYLKLDIDLVWQAAAKTVPGLKPKIAAILQQIEEDAD